MTAFPQQTTRDAPVPRRTHHSRARAYCGPAHGQSWDTNPDLPPPWTVDLVIDGGAIIVYRLVCRPGSRRPSRDHDGFYLYVPLLYEIDIVEAFAVNG